MATNILVFFLGYDFQQQIVAPDEIVEQHYVLRARHMFDMDINNTSIY